MAEDTNTIFSVIATTGSRVKDLIIKDGQLIFVQDKQRIALDFNGKRVFYNQIIILNSESDRKSILAPVEGLFYFVIETVILWTYNNSQWVQITTPTENIIYINDTPPMSGKESQLFFNTSEKNISVWDKESQSYDVIADKTESITELDINNLFN